MKNKIDYKPDGAQSVIPYLHVNAAQKLLDFMQQAFEAVILAGYPRPDGTIAHAQVRIGDSVIELADTLPALPCALHVYVPDTDAIYKRAIQAGATSLQEPADQFYGERSASIKDICGNSWYIATQTEALTKEEIDKRAMQPANNAAGVAHLLGKISKK